MRRRMIISLSGEIRGSDKYSLISSLSIYCSYKTLDFSPSYIIPWLPSLCLNKYFLQT